MADEPRTDGEGTGGEESDGAVAEGEGTEQALAAGADEAGAAEGAERPGQGASAAAPAAPEPAVGGARPLATRAAYALAALSGLLYFLAIPPLNLWPLAFVAQVPLILALRGQTVKRATALGWVAGLAFTLLAFHWLRGMLATFSEMPPPVPAILMAILCAYQSGRMALCGLLFARASNRGWPAGPVFAAAFAVSELVFPLLLPWHFAVAVQAALPLVQVAELGGVILVGLVLVAANLAIAEIVGRWSHRAPVSRALVAVGLLVPLAAVVFGWVRIGQVEAQQSAAPSIRVAMVQGNQPLMTRKGSRQLHLDLTAAAVEQGAELVVWGEGVVMHTLKTPEYEAEVMEKYNAALAVPTIVGMVMQFPAAEGSRKKYDSWNSALMFADGKRTSRYDKRFLLMFGEYIPLGNAFPVLYDLSPNSGAISPGESLEPLVFGGHRLSTSICYEAIVPPYFNDLVRKADPDLLVNLTNDAWFGDTTEPVIHLALSKFRSVEHRRYMVRATNSGVSALIDATGAVLVHGGTFQKETVMGEARFLTGGTLYRTIGDIPWWLLAAALLAGCFVRRKPRAAATV